VALYIATRVQVNNRPITFSVVGKNSTRYSPTPYSNSISGSRVFLGWRLSPTHHHRLIMNEQSQFIDPDLERNDACAVTTNPNTTTASVSSTSVTVLSSSTASTAVHGNLSVPHDTTRAVGLPLALIRPWVQQPEDHMKEAANEVDASIEDQVSVEGTNPGEVSDQDDSQPGGAPYNNVLLPSELNWESSEPLDNNFYKRIQGDKDDSRRPREPFRPRKVLDMDPPSPPLQAQPTITLPGDSLLDELVPAVVMDHVSDCHPLPLQVAQGETYHPSGQRIADTVATMSNTIASMDAEPVKSATVPWHRRRWCWVVGTVLLTVGIVLGTGCGSGKCHTKTPPSSASNKPATTTWVPPNRTRNETDPRTGVDIRTAVEVIAEHSDLTNATKALYWTGLVNELCLFDCNYTVFAPTDAAFATSNANVAKIWTPPWIMHLKGIVKNHITEQRIKSRDLTFGRTMYMLSGETVSVVHADDGAIALMSAGTNVSYVTQTDYEADNGVVHLVDALLWPSFMEMDLIGLASTDLGREYSILLELVYRLNLNNLLSSFQDVTIFAPTSAAFEALGEEKLSSLRSDKAYLQAVLSNHLAFSVIPSMGIPAGGQSYPTLSGQVAHLSFTANGTLLVNDANVLIADALANNGIVHVIDKVLLEPYSPITNTVTESSAATFSWPIWALAALTLIVTRDMFTANK
jgi:uncharacterized surface protein with fasciclin (FAS1) repeats